MTRTRKKSNAEPQELGPERVDMSGKVPVHVPRQPADWDQQVRDVLDDVHRYARTKPGGYRTPPDTRRALNADAVSRLHGLVDALDAKLRG